MNERSKRIKELFDQSGLSYIELEKKTGIKKSSLQRYASGATGKIPLDAIEAIASAFSVPAGYLMGWDEKEKSPEIEGLSEKRKALMEFAKTVPEDKAEMILRVMKSILQDGQ